MIRRLRSSSPPWWFAIALALGLRAVLHVCGFHAVEDAAPSQAFFGFIIILAELIWEGVQVAGHVTLAILTTSVSALWVFAKGAYNTALGIGRATLRGLKGAWRVTKALYTDVLRPLWSKFFKLVERLHSTLERLLKPVLSFLDRVRNEFLGFYNHWIKPITDTIDAARRILRVLVTLHVPLAAKLEEKLASIEQRIEEPFIYILGKLNELVNAINRIVDIDGLFQRLILLRTIERDIRYISRQFVNWRTIRPTATYFSQLKKDANSRTFSDVQRDYVEAVTEGGGRYGAVISEATAQLQIYLAE